MTISRLIEFNEDKAVLIVQDDIMLKRHRYLILQPITRSRILRYVKFMQLVIKSC